MVGSWAVLGSSWHYGGLLGSSWAVKHYGGLLGSPGQSWAVPEALWWAPGQSWAVLGSS